MLLKSYEDLGGAEVQNMNPGYANKNEGGEWLVIFIDDNFWIMRTREAHLTEQFVENMTIYTIH